MKEMIGAYNPDGPVDLFADELLSLCLVFWRSFDDNPFICPGQGILRGWIGVVS